MLESNRHSRPESVSVNGKAVKVTVEELVETPVENKVEAPFAAAVGSYQLKAIAELSAVGNI